MSEKREEFLQTLNQQNQESDRVFSIMHRSAQTRENFAQAQKANDEAKKGLRESVRVEGVNEADALFAIMNNSARLRENLAKAKEDIENSKRDIR